MKKLIINADDYCMSKVFNEEILRLIELWKISSTSVMVRRWIENQIDDIDRLKLICKWKKISIGLHLEFLKWETNYKNIIEDQIVLFEKYLGFSPNHIDVHKKAPDEDCNDEIVKQANLLWIPSRNLWVSKLLYKHTDWLFFSWSHKTIDEIIVWMRWLEWDKSYEILFHPGKYDEDCISSLNKDRELDVENVIEMHDFFDELWIQMISFNEL